MSPTTHHHASSEHRSFEPHESAAQSTPALAGDTRTGAIERLRHLYRSPGPYVSAYLPCGEVAERHPADVLADQSPTLRARGVSTDAVDALVARAGLPTPDHVSGFGLHVADDGSTVADYAAEGPAEPFISVGALSIAAPMIEWDQWRVPHVTVNAAVDGAEIVTFLPHAPPTIVPTGSTAADIAAHCRQLAVDDSLRLIVVGGEDDAVRDVMARLAGMVPVDTRVVEVDRAASSSIEQFADAVVRHVADVVARDTVRTLEDFRFYAAGGRVAQGSVETFEALARDEGQLLVVHDDPHDPTTASFGSDGRHVSADPRAFAEVARRADVAIWSAISQGVDVRILPTTGDNGPRDNIALMLDRPRSQTPLLRP